jgi:hypothetical protein
MSHAVLLLAAIPLMLGDAGVNEIGMTRLSSAGAAAPPACTGRSPRPKTVSSVDGSAAFSGHPRSSPAAADDK